jgi:rubredoxin
MAKYRCPSCGASHKDAPSSCRLCGYIMDGSVEMPAGGAQARAPIEKKGGLGGFALIGLLVVVLLGAGAVVFHYTSGNATVAKVIDKLPGQSAPPDGWKTVTDAEGGFTVSLPPNPTPTSVKFPAADNGQLTGWVGTIGEAPQVDTQLYVIYGKIHPKPGEKASDTVSRMGDLKMTLDPGFIVSQQVTSYQGYPAMQYTINRVKFQTGQGFENALLFLKGDQLFVVESISKYSGDPADSEFNQVLNSLTFTA